MDDRSPMSLARFRAVLDAYGANPERWPPEERDAARALLAQSRQAQRWYDASAQLDAVLDFAPAAAASPTLVERILAATPAPPRATIATARPQALRRAAVDTTRWAPWRSWRYAGAAVPLAAAAALLLWLLVEPSGTPERTDVILAEIGTYDAPTDALLDVPGVAALDQVPAFGCTTDGLGCLDATDPNDHSQSALEAEKYV